jgi:hypothetical protein
MKVWSYGARQLARAMAVVALLMALAPAVGVARADGIILPPPTCFDVVVPLPGPVPLQPQAGGLEPAPATGLTPLVPGISLADPAQAPSNQISPPFAVTPVPLPPIIRPPAPPIPPRPIVPCWLTIRYHRVDVQIAGQVATTRVDQLFVNQTGRRCPKMRRSQASPCG